MKRFNVTGTCVGTEHYMVDISGKLDEIEKLVDGKQYFTINRARQFGKTTTLFHLFKRLESRGYYVCARITFENAGIDAFASEEAFCGMFLGKVSDALGLSNACNEYAKSWDSSDVVSFRLLDKHIAKLCKGVKTVLMIDEVDKSSNNQLFLHFLGLLRAKYLFRQEGMDHTFHSVILAGVTDIKNLKLKLINDGLHVPAREEGRIINSPWNIAADFEVDMSFSPSEIEAMLRDYESEHKTGMVFGVVANEIHKHTNGYPFLVSRICKHIDEKLDKNWSVSSVEEAVRIILWEANVLFADMAKNLGNYKILYDFMYELLIVGETKTFVIDNPVVSLANTFGYIKRANGSHKIAVYNKIFEVRMARFFASMDENSQPGKRSSGVIYRDVIKDGKFDMAACLIKFAEHYREIYTDKEEHFHERHGRLLFMSFLTPLLNGQGFIHIETGLTDERRMDLVVDFEKEQFIVELKIWRGDAAKERAYEQLLGYMETKNATAGYLLTFDFRKNKTGKYNAEWVDVGGKKVFDVVL